MSLKKFTVTLDPEKVDVVRKSGAELSSFLRTCMEERTVSSTEGVKVEGSAMEKLSEKFKALEAKVLKMDIDFKTAKNNYDHSYRRMHRYIRSKGEDL